MQKCFGSANLGGHSGDTVLIASLSPIHILEAQHTVGRVVDSDDQVASCDEVELFAGSDLVYAGNAYLYKIK